MIKLQISESDNPKKKYKATFTKPDGKTKTIQFGASGYQDYLQSHDKNQRDRYRKRHEKDLKGDPMRAGYLSYYILWGNSVNMQSNIRSFKNKYNFV